MAGLVPAIHVFDLARPQDVDARDKRGHDGQVLGPRWSLSALASGGQVN
jgi:hypothetical protein